MLYSIHRLILLLVPFSTLQKRRGLKDLWATTWMFLKQMPGVITAPKMANKWDSLGRDYTHDLTPKEQS